MFLNLFKFEWRFYLGRISFWSAVVLFTFFGFAITGRLGTGGRTMINAPFATIPIYLLLTLFSLMMISVFAGISVLRDESAKMTELVFASGVRKVPLILARFLGLVTVSMAVLVFAGFGMVLRSYLPHGLDGIFTANSPRMHLYILLVYVLPNILLISALILATALLSGNRVLTYAMGMALYGLYLISAIFVGSPFVGGNLPAEPGLRRLAAVLDPTGITAFYEQTELWTLVLRNSAMPHLEGPLLWNRLLWLAVAGLALGWVLWRYKLQLPDHGAKRPSPDEAVLHAAASSSSLPAYHPVPPQFSARQFWLALRSTIHLEWAHLLKQLPFWVVVAVWTLLLLGEIMPLVHMAEFGAPLLPATSRVLARFQFDILPRLTLFVLVFYSGELVWRERELKMEAFLDATPSHNAVFFLAKLATLTLVPFTLIAISILLGMGFQLSQGYVQLEMGLYLSLFIYGGIPLFFHAVLCLSVQSLAPNKYFGMLLAGLLVFAFGTNLGNFVGLEHPLWRFAGAPLYNYSDMNGYRHINESYFSYMAYWGGLTGLLGLLGFGLQSRSRSASLVSRIRQCPANLGRFAQLATVVSLVVFLSMGGLIYYRTNLKNHYYSEGDSERWHADYERTFHHFENVPMPKIDKVHLQMDLFPTTTSYRAKSSYRLVNPHAFPLDDALVCLDPDLILESLDLEGAQLVEAAPRLGTYHFRFDAPLSPGGHAVLSFEIRHHSSGYASFASFHRVADNGTMLHLGNKFPSIGYVVEQELHDPIKRKRQGLPERRPVMPLEDEIALAGGDFRLHHEAIECETIVSTDADQTALAPGDLLRRWEADGRRYFHYKTSAPIRNWIVVLSARYAVAQTQVDGIQLELFYHPDHPTNVERMLEGMKEGLRYCKEHFGPYPHRQLRLAEVPEFSGATGFAAPTLILIGEHYGFTHDLRGDHLMDQVYRRVAHETAHQWWGHGLVPAEVQEGSLILVETLARYSELMIMKQHVGPEMAKRFADFEAGRYFRGRAREAHEEMPLSRIREAQSYLMYSKGAAAMYALHSLIGEEVINRVLRQLVLDHTYPRNPATSLDLIQGFLQAAPDQAAFIKDWFTDVVFYRSQIQTAEVGPLPGGRFQLNLELKLEKLRYGQDGQDLPLHFEQTLDLAVTTLGDGQAVVQVVSVPVKDGMNQIQLAFDNVPTHLELDPYRLYLDQNRERAETALVAVP